MNATGIIRRVSMGVLLVSGAVLLIGCDEDGSHGGAAGGQPNMRFTDVKITQTEARYNDIITVSWKYAGPGELRSQAVEFIWWDCTGLKVSRREIGRSARNYTFNFTRPVTVHVIANTSRGTTDFAIDVHNAEEYFFTIRNLYNSHPHLFNTGNAARATTATVGALPTTQRSGARAPSRVFERRNPEIRFDHFMAWTDGNENGVIDLMASGEEGIELPEDMDFFMHSVGNTTQACGDGWRCMPTTSGSAYAEITDGLHDDVAAGYQAVGIPPDMTHTNVVIFAATIVNDGVVLQARDEKGNVVAARQNITRFDTLFCSIEMAGNNGIGGVSNIALGNIRQGMVVNAFRDGLANTHPGVSISFHGEYNHPEAPSKGGHMTGEFYEAVLGLRLAGETPDAQAQRTLGFRDTGIYVQLGHYGNKPGEHSGIEFAVPYFWDDDVRFDLCAQAR